jgi:hypothetical protein
VTGKERVMAEERGGDGVRMVQEVAHDGMVQAVAHDGGGVIVTSGNGLVPVASKDRVRLGVVGGIHRAGCRGGQGR